MGVAAIIRLDQLRNITIILPDATRLAPLCPTRFLIDPVKQILIITSKEDTHPTSVINLLEERNIPFFRLNTEALMVDYEFSWIQENGKCLLMIKDKYTGKVLDESSILSVWYRRPVEPCELPYRVDEQIDEHNKKEARAFYLYLMYYLSDFYSIGNHLFDKYANSKLVQLKLASGLGMKVPNTCLSNKKSSIVGFAEKYNDIILKPLIDYFVFYEEKIFSLYVRKLTSNQLQDVPEESFNQTVSFCEDYIEKKYEVRVTIMGTHTFACKLDSQAQGEETGKIDWRQGIDHNLRHEMITLPETIETFCRNYLRKLHLHFGCFDFIVTPEDEYVFLECNPNGQWGWIEDELGVPMSEAMVDCLVNKREV